MADVGTLVMKITADAKQFNDEINKSKGSIDKLKTVAKVGAGAIVAGAAALGTMAVKAAGTTDNIDKMSQRLGLSRKSYQEWQFVLSQSGIEIDSLQAGMKTLSQKMGDVVAGAGPGVEIFKKLNVSVLDSTGAARDQEDVFNDTITALQNMKDGVEKASLAQELFGRSGQEMLPLLNSNAEATEALKDRANELGLVLSDESIDAGVKFTDTMDQMKRSMGTIVSEIGVSVMPIFQTMLEWIVENMPAIRETFETVFGVIKTVISTVYNFVNDNLMPIFDSMKETASTAMEAIQPIAETVFGKIVEVATTLYNFIKDNVIVIFEGVKSFWDENGESIKTAAVTVFEGVLTVVTAVWEFIKTYVLPIFSDIVSAVVDNFPKIWSTASTVFQNVIDIATTLWQLFEDNLLPIIEGVYNFIKDNFPSIGTIISTAFDIVLGAINGVIDTFKTIVDWIQKAIDKLKEFFGAEADQAGTGGFSVGGTQGTVGSIVAGQRANGGPVMGGKSYLVGERGPEIFTPGVNGSIGGTSNVTINVNGSGDPEMVANEIVRILNTQGIRG